MLSRRLKILTSRFWWPITFQSWGENIKLFGLILSRNSTFIRWNTYQKTIEMVGTSNFLICLVYSKTRLIQHYHKIPSGVLTHPSHPSLPTQSPSPTPASAYFLLKRSLVIFKIKTIDSCLSESIDHCLRHGSCTGKIVYEMQKWNNWNSNICYSLDARRTYSDISTESVVQTNNWEPRHNFLALEEVKQRLCFSFALFPELINNEYFLGIQREYFNWLRRRLRPSADAWRASYDS